MKLHGLLSLISPPSPNLNVTAKTNYARLKELLKNSTNTPRVLIVGGGETLGYGIENLGKDILKKAINSDICPSPGVDVVADGQFLPFKDSIFDGLIAQAVLYYFQNPLLGVTEIYRVLKPGGYVFVDTPFMHAYLNTPADRVRFTLPGLEKLFSDFGIVSFSLKIVGDRFTLLG
ncbi:MAG: class I SAM-dependent methyltransferase, partial [bacterium]|nr:class I SAM-dependent methyltransferase [bacterium]